MTYASPTTINASNGITELLAYTNSVTSSWLSNMILIAIYVIVLIGYYRAKDDFVGGMATAGFGTFVVGLLFWIGGFISGITLSIVIGILFIGVVVLFVDTKNN